ncbi:MAG: choice-of-anchor D domain-containing protein [Myxococcales bacterium]|nr:choice-of-anchor D domain-containing protein [Myxococcales bacterium]
MRSIMSLAVLGLCGWVMFSGFSCGPTLQNCSIQSDCPADHRCRSYSCQLLDHCQSDSDCNAPRSCIKNRCVDPKTEACRVDQDCASGEQCVSGACKTTISNTCQSNNDCKNGEICSQQKCIPDPNKPNTCQSNSDCKTGEICSQQTCVPDPNKPNTCQSNSDCKSNEICSNGQCTPNQQGVCRLGVSPSSLEFYDLKLGESKTQSLTLSNQGDGACQLGQITLQDAQGTSGIFSLPTPPTAQSLAAGGSLKIDVKFEAIAAGSHNATLEIFSGANLLKSVKFYSFVKGDTTLPGSGWGTVFYESSFDGGDYIGGCFWDDQTFEVAAERVFREGGINASYGNLRLTKDGGNSWNCVNCVQGQGFPRTAFYEIVDMTLSGLSCLNGRGYVYGSFFDADPNTFHSTLYTRTAQDNWKPDNDRNNSLNNSSGSPANLFVADGRWFLLDSGSFLRGVVPDANGAMKTQTLSYYEEPQGNTRAYAQSFDVAQNTAALVGFRRSFGRSTQITPFLVYNTTNAVLPNGTSLADVSKYWTSATPPCTSCILRNVRVLGPQSFLVMGNPTDAQQNPTGVAIWRTENRGASWTKVYELTSSVSLYNQDMIVISSQHIVAVAGGPKSSQGGGFESEGLLLESVDGGKTFSSIAVSQLKGKSIDTGKIPSLYALRLSPDRKTLYVLGQGVILRWKP